MLNLNYITKFNNDMHIFYKIKSKPQFIKIYIKNYDFTIIINLYNYHRFSIFYKNLII
mgnify:CR=1 FL=1